MKIIACIVIVGLLVGCGKEKQQQTPYDGDSSKVAINETART